MSKKSEEKIDKVMRYFTEQKYLIKGLEKCIYKQQSRISKLEIELYKKEKEENIQFKKQFQKQLQCAAKGHNFVFDKAIKQEVVFYVPENLGCFQFKCSNCNLTITKTKDELTPTEKKALIGLKILEQEKLEENNAKTT